MKSKIEFLNDLIIGEDGLLVNLRMGSGFDEFKYNLICDTISELTSMLKNSTNIPKSLAVIIVDLYYSIKQNSDLYNEEEEEKILYAAAKINELIFDLIKENL